MKAKKTLLQQAIQANGRSRMCKNCPVGQLKCVSMNYLEVCSKAFLEGYMKGYIKSKSEARKQYEKGIEESFPCF